MPSRPTPAALQVRSGYPCTVAYVGTREQLLAAGVAVPAMFPEPPHRRRWARHRPEHRDIAPDDWTVSLRKDGRWRVSREDGWEHPEQIRAEHARSAAERGAWQWAGNGSQDEQSNRTAAAEQSAAAYARGPMTAAEYRRKLCGPLAGLREDLAIVMGGTSTTNGYRLAPHAAEEILEQLDQLIGDLQDAEVQRPSALDGLATPLAACVQSAIMAAQRQR